MLQIIRAKYSSFKLSLGSDPYFWPSPDEHQPPIASAMSGGHSTALSLSLRLCRKEWLTHLSGTRHLRHLLSAPPAELVEHLPELVY